MMDRRRTFLTLIAVLCFALASVVSASRMAPASPQSPEIQQFLAMGGTLDDLCGGQLPDHAHHCEFCHLLPDTPIVAPGAHVWQLALDHAPQQHRDLTAPGQRPTTHISARAPPAFA